MQEKKGRHTTLLGSGLASGSDFVFVLDLSSFSCEIFFSSDLILSGFGGNCFRKLPENWNKIQQLLQSITVLGLEDGNSAHNYLWVPWIRQLLLWVSLEVGRVLQVGCSVDFEVSSSPQRPWPTSLGSPTTLPWCPAIGLKIRGIQNNY